jgi:hypothetical protein
VTTIQIPTPDDLRSRLRGVDQLLTAKRWERAAIVWAYTEVQTNRGHGIRPGVQAPRMNVRNFAGQGYQGLSTPKSVSRYREAWATAIANGWAGPVEPGQTVELPDEPFPAWPYGEGSTWEDHAADVLHPGRGPSRPLGERVLGSLDRAATALLRLSEAAAEGGLEESVRQELIGRLVTLRQEADAALVALTAELPVPS